MFSSLLVCNLPTLIILTSMLVWRFVYVFLSVCQSRWFASVLVSRRFGQPTFWFVDVSIRRRFNSSTFLSVDVSVYRRFGLSTFLVCRSFDQSPYSTVPFIKTCSIKLKDTFTVKSAIVFRSTVQQRRLRYPSKTHVKQTFCENWLALTYFIICPEHGSYFHALHNSQNDCDTEINIVGDRHLTRFDLYDLLRIFIYCNSSGWLFGWRCGK